MSEEATITTPAPETPPVETPPAAIRPEWFPEKYFTDGGPSDVEKLGKSYTELQKAFSTKNPHLAELPADPTGYQFKPEKLPDGFQWSDDLEAHFGPAFHAAQLGNGQAKAIVQAFVEYEEKTNAAAIQAYETQTAEAAKALAEKWGGEEKFAEKKDAIASFVAGKLGADAADPVLFSNPKMIEFLGATHDYVKSLEAQLGEDALARAKESVAAGIPNLSNHTEAKRIMSDPAHPKHAAYLKGDAAVVQEVLNMLAAKS